MEREYRGRTLEACIQKAMLLERQNAPKNLLMYELMLNLPEEDIDIEREMRDTQEKLDRSAISSEEQKYLEAKKCVLDLVGRYKDSPGEE